MNATATEDEVAFYYFRRYYRWKIFINFTDSKYGLPPPCYVQTELYGQQHNAYLLDL
jgi:hypothetical protein